MSNRQAPRFRPRRTRPPGTRRRLWLTLAAAGGLLILAAAGVFIALAVSGDGGTGPAPIAGSTAAASSTGGTRGGPEPLVKPPAAAYTVQLGDLNPNYRVLPPETFILSASALTASGIFASPSDGDGLLKQWHYRDGYQASYQPAGQLADVLQGKYYIQVQALLFDDQAGARDAYAYIQDQHGKITASDRQSAAALGNESSGFRILSGTVGPSELPQVYHRFIFRRGSMVALVQTTGVDQFMTIDQARDIAVAVDDKALGNRPAPTPTPGRGGTPVLPAPPTITPVR